MGKIIKDTIHAAGVDIGIYTQDFENEFISLTDIARYKSDDPTAVIQNWMRNRDVIEFLGLWERLHNPDFKPLEFEGVKKQAGANAFTMSPKKWIEATDAIKGNLFPPELTPAQAAYTYANEADMLNVVLFGKTAKQWKDENPNEKGNMRDGATLNQLLVLANLESYNAVLISQGKNQKERMELLRQLAVQQLQTLETVSLNNLPKIGKEK
ncbi:MAG TPA: KilA-N domain-containing protein [Candidatus Mediterraneibacter cottocaccae]|nr:KilA-N domain-containing protein [Candidatus Mediterraneibacter cottocaccae]